MLFCTCQNDPPGSNALHKQIVEVFVRSKWSEDCVIMPHRQESYLKDSSSACDGMRIDVHYNQIEYFVGSLTNFRRWFITNIDTLPLNLILTTNIHSLSFQSNSNLRLKSNIILSFTHNFSNEHMVIMMQKVPNVW